MDNARVARELVKLAKELSASPDRTCYILLNVGKYSVEVIVTGVDDREIQSACTHLMKAAEEEGASVDDDHPNYTPSNRDWGYMGFTAEEEPEYMKSLVQALTKEAQSISWAGLEVGKGRWPRI